MFRFILATALSLALPIAASASPKAMELPEMEHADAELVIVAPDGSETGYSPADLESFPTYRLNTPTPWRTVAANFDGVLLVDVLAAHGLADVEAILVSAENDYSTTIPRAVWESIDVMIATRVDGAPNSRRTRGPIQIVAEMNAFQASDIMVEDHLVWMAARIEAVR